jgi:hypothetical protein
VFSEQNNFSSAASSSVPFDGSEEKWEQMAGDHSTWVYARVCVRTCVRARACDCACLRVEKRAERERLSVSNISMCK